MTDTVQRFVVCAHPRDLNDATFHYVQLLRTALQRVGWQDLGVHADAASWREADVLVTLSAEYAARAEFHGPGKPLVHWFQGIEAVERRHLHGGFKGWWQHRLWSALEQRILRKARLKLFVSEEMRRFLGDEETPASRSIVIPCYNVGTPAAPCGPADRYTQLDLAYAGSLVSWQCVDDVFGVARALRERGQAARLTIYTRQQDEARQRAAAFGLIDVCVRSVAPNELVDALQAHSHGFILRESMPINEVSTPTKFSTYLAAGVIPVLTQATPALVRMAQDIPSAIVAASPHDHAGIADALIRQQRAGMPTPSELHAQISRVFAQHFNDEQHIAALCALLRAW